MNHVTKSVDGWVKYGGETTDPSQNPQFLITGIMVEKWVCCQKSGKFQARKKESGDFTFLTPCHYL